MARKQEQKEKALARMLSYVLGVAPHEFGLLPDEDGWIKVKELVKALGQEDGWRFVRESILRDLAIRVAPGAIELDEGRIRSKERTPPSPEYSADPPPHLYLGVRSRAWPAFKRRGLETNQSGPVMLATDPELALKLGSRRGPDPLLVTIQAQEAMDQGVVFSAWGEKLFICDWVPALCLMGPSISERPPAKKPAQKKAAAVAKMPPPESMPGSFIMNIPTGDEKPYKEKGLHKKIKWKDDRRKDRRRGR